MIVIPSHNGARCLPQLIESIKFFGSHGEKILIVDQGTHDPDSLNYLQNIDKGELDLSIVRNENSSYEAGALYRAYEEYPDEQWFILIQDSMQVIEPDWIKKFKDKMAEGFEVCGWISFFPAMICTGPGEQFAIDWAVDGLPHDVDTVHGIFGSNFACTRKALDQMYAAGYNKLKPENKVHSMAYERIWPIAFHKLMIPQTTLVPMGFHHDDGNRPCFVKQHMLRQ